MEKLRAFLRSVPITFESWLLSFVGIVLIRTFFEQFSNPQNGRFAVIDVATIVHYTVFYIAAVVSISVILYIFAKTDTRETLTLATLGLPIIITPPIIDLLYAGVGGHVMTYFFVPGQELLTRFFTFWGGHIEIGITLGIQIEIFLVMVFCFTYVYIATKNLRRSIGAAFTFYFVIFLFVSVPSLFALIGPEGSNTSTTVFEQIFSSRIIIDNIHPSFGASKLALFDLGFNKVMTGIFTIITILLVQLFFFLTAKEKVIAVIKNSRPERIFHFFLLFIFGAALAYKADWFANWIDVMTYLLTFAAFKSAWIFSVCQNDIHDEEIDRISNPNRPLISKTLSKKDLILVSKLSIFSAFLCAYTASSYAVFFVLLFTLVYFIYSNPPFRLKRFVLVNSFLVSLACLSVTMAGFFAVSTEKSLLTFPPSLVLAIIVIFTAAANVKDIKDMEGDRAAGIKTLPVILGLKKSKMLIAGVMCFFILYTPLYFDFSSLTIPSIATSALLWYFINKEKYIEWKVFAIYMLYLILLIGTLISK